MTAFVCVCFLLSRDLFIHKHVHLFDKWLFKLSTEVLLLSSKYPLISGFYKLKTLCMHVAIKRNYFSVNIQTSKQSNKE